MRTLRLLSFTLAVPFDGDGNLLQVSPRNHVRRLDRAVDVRVVGQELHFPYEEEIGSADELSEAYAMDLSLVSDNFNNLRSDLTAHNEQLEPLIREKLRERRALAEKNQSIVQSLDIPIRRKSDQPNTYVIPGVARKPTIRSRPSSAADLRPEPVLSEETYEDILTTIASLALMMERNPATFSKLDEEEIRDHFLLSLNGLHEGNATGETFNGGGKTDILIRHDNANVFIAECKFWKGPKSLHEAIEQLLGYVTWRDTKTAILLLYRGAGLTSVVSKARAVVEEHPNYLGDRRAKSRRLHDDTIQNVTFRHPADKDKRMLLSVLAYQVPG
jgi:hypothetical protein